MKRINSEITGVLDRGTRHASTGGSPGITAYGQSEIDAARLWLIGKRPADVDKALLTSAMSSHGVGLTLTTESRFPEGGGSYQLVTGCGIEGRTENLPALMQRIELAMTPLTRIEAEGLVLRLQVATAGKSRSEVNAEAALDLYAGALLRYPADVAVAVVERVALGQTGVAWFPTLAEVVNECERMAAPRTTILTSLKAWKAPTTEQALVTDIEDWRRLAYRAREDMFAIPRPSPEDQSELAEFEAHALDMVKLLREVRSGLFRPS